MTTTKGKTPTHGVKTEWGERNAAFIQARKCARKMDREGVEKAIKTMNAIQQISKREQAAIDKAAR
jgi:hypothetical protein